MSPVPVNERDEDMEAKLIFIRLQPVINPLLQTIQEYRGLITAPTRNIKSILSSLQIQTQLLERLHTTIFLNLAAEHQLSNKQLSQSLFLLLDYILFPILAILKGTEIGWNGDEQIDDQTPVLKSASFLVVQHAASLLCASLDLLQFPPEEKFIRCLIACAFALPTSQYLSNQYRCDTSLDRGDSCLKYLLDGIRRLVGHSGFTTNRKFANSLANALDGALIARLVDCIVALVEPSESGKPANLDLQDQSLLTLRTIMKAVPIASVWRHMFPGIFAGVYRCCLQVLRVAQQSPKLATISLTVISDLLRICIPSDAASSRDLTQGSTEKIVTDKLKSLAFGSDNGTEAGQSSAGNVTSNVDEFVARANKFLPTPLTILINIMTVAHAPQVREYLVGLIAVVLVHSPSFWQSDSNIVTVAFEACLVLSQDSQQAISSSASAVLIDYKEKIGLDNLISIPRVVGPRIMSILGGLPAMLEAARDIDLVSSLRLVNGYLTAMTLFKDTSKKLKTFMMTEENMSTLMAVFSLLCSPSARQREDLDNRPMSLTSLVLQNERRTKITITGGENGEVQNIIESTLFSLSRLLGMKATVYAVDQCVADLYADIEARRSAGFSQNGLNQVAWSNSWAGTIFFSSFLLKGLSASTLKCRKQDIFRQLANSTLPLIFSEPVWGVPIGNDLCAINGLKSRSTLTRQQGLVPTVMSANADLIVALLDVIESITDFMEATSVEGHLDIMLLPLLEKANTGVPKVSDRALSVLHKIATFTADSEFDSLLVNRVESIFGAIMLKVRIPGGRPAQKENAVSNEVLVAARVASFVLHSITQNFEKAAFFENSDEDLDARVIVSPEEVIRELILRYDLAGSDVHSNSISTGAFLTLFRNMSSLLFAFYELHTQGVSGNQKQQHPEPWFDLLESFREAELTPAEGFAQHFKQNQQAQKDPSNVVGLPTSHLQRDTDFMALLLSRSAYTLSHPSLSIQIESCNALISGFYFLAIIASIPVPPGEEETNGPRTAILRQIHSVWPAVSARLKAVSAEVAPSNKTSLVVMFSAVQPKHTDISEKRMFLVKLFELVAGMAEASDDFMARRFRDVVWPCIGGLLSYFLKGRNSQESAHLSQFTESEIDLLCSIISCCGRMFKHRATGELLSGLIPSIGGVLIPFLGYANQRVADLCTDTFQAILCVDNDTLRRPLFALAGLAFRSCPLFDQSDCGVEGTVALAEQKAVDESTPAAHKAAAHLINFLEELPEQALIL